MAVIERSFLIVISYLFGLVMSQVPSDRRVTTEPSGCVTLALEKACVPAVPELEDELALDDVEPPLECMVVVLPPIVVEDVTFPPPAVTDDAVSPAAELLLSITVQVVPSSSVTVSADAWPAKKRPRTSDIGMAPQVILRLDFMSDPPKMRPAA
nr:hypothetical protein [uncultured Shinella sp.]